MPEEKERIQALVLADSFDHRFLPITLDRPRALIPVLGVPLLDYTIEFLLSSNIQDIIVFCCSHAELIQEHINKSQWLREGSGNGRSIRVLVSKACTSAGDALREVCSSGWIKSTFVLISADVISNINLNIPLQAHLERAKKSKSNIMTMIFGQTNLQNRTRSMRDSTIIGIDRTSKQLKWFDSSSSTTSKWIRLEQALINRQSPLELRHDIIDCRIDICSPEVLFLFNENFDWQDLRLEFFREVLLSEIYGYKIFAHVISSDYATRASDPGTYQSICNDIITRWVFPIAPEIPFNGGEPYRYLRKHIYLHDYVKLAMTSQIDQDTLIGKGTVAEGNTFISRSSIGQNCKIGSNVKIIGSQLWDNVTVHDGVEIYNSIICSNVEIFSNSIINEQSILAENVKIGPNASIPKFTSLSIWSKSELFKKLSDRFDLSKISTSSSSSVSTKEKEKEKDGSGNESDPFLLNNIKIQIFEKAEWGQKGKAYQWTELQTDQEEENDESDEDSFEDVDSNEDPEDRLQKKLNEEVKEIIHSEQLRTKDKNELTPPTINALQVEIRSRLFANNSNLEITFLHVSQAITKAVLDLISGETNAQLATSTKTLLKKYSPLLRTFLDGQDQVNFIHFLEIQAEADSKVNKLFVAVLHTLYDNDVLQEDAILSWENDEPVPALVEECGAFLRWLKEAEEDSDSE